MEPRAYICLVLHAHLPFVRHPEQNECLEERWLFEAINESYLPLVQILENLLEKNIDFRLTISLSPTLLSMLLDPFLQERFLHYLTQRIELAEKEVKRNKYHPPLHLLAKMYYKKFTANKVLYEKYKRNLILAFKKFQTQGKIQIITCPATHSFFPLLKMDPPSIRTQIETALQLYTSIFGNKPHGVWLPECGYYPGLDDFLRSYGLRFFFLDAHGFQFADPQPKYAVYAPIYCPSGIAAFGRDQRSARQVWSAQYGYPGDPDYREFYRDAGHELEFDYVRPYIYEDVRVDTGIKYYKITGPTETKIFYDPQKALNKAKEHAEDFFKNISGYSLYLEQKMSRPPLFVSLYDAELFGHWWYEGPQWLDFFMQACAKKSFPLKMITPSEYLEKFPINQVVQPAASSWGLKGYNEMWLNDTNDWIYAPLHQAGRIMEKMTQTFTGSNGIKRRALNQALRELLLAQGSDWAFIMKAKTMPQYATQRIVTHLSNFRKLSQQINTNTINPKYLQSLEGKNNLFPDINFEMFKR